MYNPYNNMYGNLIDKIDNQIKELQNLRKTYQTQPQTAPIKNASLIIKKVA